MCAGPAQERNAIPVLDYCPCKGHMVSTALYLYFYCTRAAVRPK